jgi:hypothetical protein
LGEFGVLNNVDLDIFIYIFMDFPLNLNLIKYFISL